MHGLLNVKFINYRLAVFSYNRIYDPLLQSTSILYYIYQFYRFILFKPTHALFLKHIHI